MKNHSRILNLLVISIFFLLPLHTVIGASEGENSKAIDMMIAIDNSCSMFPKDKILKDCQSWGSDANYLRLQGTDLFFARLGFNEPNEADYQLGVISFGDQPVEINPLQPIANLRDTLAAKIAHPLPQTATLLLPALKMAYNELRTSPNRRADNLPTVVLITDGVPWPKEGQSYTDIEQTLKQNLDIPLFIMLLKNPYNTGEDFEQYIHFWQQMQSKYSSVFVYPINDVGEIEATYNSIISQLQNTSPTVTAQVTQQKQQKFFVSKYVKQIIFTVIHSPSKTTDRAVSIVDSSGKIVTNNDPGVTYFLGIDNPVDIYSIEEPRLSEQLLNNYWQISTKQDADIFINVRGLYHFNILSPTVVNAGVSNVYKLTSRMTPNKQLSLKFSFVSDDGSTILDPQHITGYVLPPDGKQVVLSDTQLIMSNAQGVYELDYDFSRAYPQITQTPGRFILTINASPINNLDLNQNPIVTMHILVDVGPTPFIRNISPGSIECNANNPSPLKITLGDYQYAQPGSTVANAILDNKILKLETNDVGEISGDIASLCANILPKLACSSQSNSDIQINVQTELSDLGYQQVISDSIPIRIIAPICTPQVVIPTIPIAITPTVNPVIDTDKDGVIDTSDHCPQTPGWSMFNGCPPNMLFPVLLAIIFLAFLFYVAIYYYRKSGFTWMGDPPQGYIAATRRDTIILDPVDIYQIGTKKRVREIKIGGDASRVQIHIIGLNPVEFIVTKQKDRVFLTDASSGMLKATFRNLVSEEVSTSNSEITLWICSNYRTIQKDLDALIKNK